KGGLPPPETEWHSRRGGKPPFPTPRLSNLIDYSGVFDFPPGPMTKTQSFKRTQYQMTDLRNASLSEVDPLISQAIDNEVARQANGLELIASENFVSEAVLEAAGSVFTNKYAEGYPKKRYYGGCEWTDVVEQLAIDRAKEMFGAEHANVQPHSGAQANMAVYLAAIQYGDQILGMNLSHGGHLTHGHPMNFSGISYKVA